MIGNSIQNHAGGSAVADDWQQTQEAGNRSQNTTSLSQSANEEQPQNTWQKIQNFRVEFGPNSKDILNFTNQLAIMVQAGISLNDSLEAIAEQQTNLKFRKVLYDLKDRIEGGQNFSQALSEYPQVFSNIYISMVAAAEISGSLSGMLRKLSEYLNRDAETKSQIKGAMVYPAIIAFMAVAASIFLLCFVLPKFGGIFAGKEHLLPLPTKLLLGGSAFIRYYWFLILPAIAGMFFGVWYFVGTEIGRFWWDKTKLKLPIIRSLCRCLYITRSLYTMGVLAHAGVAILDTISITAQVSGNVLFKNMWLSVHEEVRQGKKIASSLSAFNLMPANVVQMIRSGEDSGTLSDVLKEVSEYYGRELRTIIKTVTSMIEPIMIVLMGVLVGFIAMSIMLPIFQMSKLVTSN